MSDEPISDSMTVLEARRLLNGEADEGIVCPCCSRLVKNYRRKLHRENVSFLVVLVAAYRADPRWYHIRELGGGNARKASTDATYMVYWGLLERKAGMYRPTEAGVRFALGLTAEPDYVILRNDRAGTVVEWSDNRITAREVQGFNFQATWSTLGVTTRPRKKQVEATKLAAKKSQTTLF